MTAERSVVRVCLAGIVWATTALCTIVSCTNIDGSSAIEGTLHVPECWSGPLRLQPDLMAASLHHRQLQIRLQRGGDFQNFSDGVTFVVHDVGALLADPSRGTTGRIGQPLIVDLPPEVTPPGVPIVTPEEPAFVAMSMFLQKSCASQNVALHAVRQVKLPSDGACAAPPLTGADPLAGCSPTSAAPAGVGSGRSRIAFLNLGAKRNSSSPSSTRPGVGSDVAAASEPDISLDDAQPIEGCFDIYLADPRDGFDGPRSGQPGEALPPCRGHLRGTFRFRPSRGRPSQAFP